MTHPRSDDRSSTTGLIRRCLRRPRFLLVVALLIGAAAVSAAGGLPPRRPGVALGSAPLLLLERMVLLFGLTGGMGAVLESSWHGHLPGAPRAAPKRASELRGRHQHRTRAAG